MLLPLPQRSPKHVISCCLIWLLLSQGQPSSGDGLPLYPHSSPDINQRVTRGPRPRPRHLLVDPLAAVQADVRLGRGQAHVALPHVVGAHRCASLLFFSRQIGTCLFIPSLVATVSDSVDVPLRDSVHPYAAGLVRPPVASVVAEAERDRDLYDRDPRPPAVLQPSPPTPTWVFLPAGGWKFRTFA